MTLCTWCKEEAEPVEYNPAPLDPSEPWFCSTYCEESLSAAQEAYEEGRYTGAPVY